MGRIRRTSNAIEKAVLRLNNLKAVSPTLDLGGGLSVTAFDALIKSGQDALDDYNQSVAALDDKSNSLAALEKQIAEMTTRALAGVGARYGKNSSEYETAGGVRTAEIKRTRKTPKKD